MTAETEHVPPRPALSLSIRADELTTGDRVAYASGAGALHIVNARRVDSFRVLVGSRDLTSGRNDAGTFPYGYRFARLCTVCTTPADEIAAGRPFCREHAGPDALAALGERMREARETVEAAEARHAAAVARIEAARAELAAAGQELTASREALAAAVDVHAALFR